MSGGRFGMVPARAFDDTRMTDSLIAVLGLVATYGNRDGWHPIRLREMAERRGVSKQAVSGAVQKLIGFGYIETRSTVRRDGGQGWNLYRVLHDVDLPPAHQRVPPSSSEIDGSSSPEVDGRRQTPVTDSVPNGTGGTVPALSAEVPYPEIFVAVAEAWTGEQWPMKLTSSAKGRIGKAATALRSVGATADEIAYRAANYAQQYESRPTPQALESHWPALAQGPPTPMRGSNRSLANGARWLASRQKGVN